MAGSEVEGSGHGADFIDRESLELNRERVKRNIEDQTVKLKLRREKGATRDKLEIEKFEFMMAIYCSTRKESWIPGPLGRKERTWKGGFLCHLRYKRSL